MSKIYIEKNVSKKWQGQGDQMEVKFLNFIGSGIMLTPVGYDVMCVYVNT